MGDERPGTWKEWKEARGSWASRESFDTAHDKKVERERREAKGSIEVLSGGNAAKADHVEDLKLMFTIVLEYPEFVGRRLGRSRATNISVCVLRTR